MQKRIILPFVLTFLTLSNSFGQIIIEEEKKLDDTETKVIKSSQEKPVRQTDSISSVYFNTNWSSTFRTLTPNTGLFGEELGERADETRASFWSFGVGLRNQMSSHFSLEIGLGIVRNGEEYSYEDADSSFNYNNKYTFVSMPIIAYYTYGKDIKFFAGGGFMPQLFMSQVEDQNWVTPTNTKKSNEIITKNGTSSHATVTASAIIRTGIQFSYSNFWSVYIMPEYRVQLGSTYGKTSDYIHKANAIGFNLGLTYQL